MAVNIISTSKELTPVERYLMTVAPNIRSVKDIPDDTTFNAVASCVFEDVKEDGDVATIFSVLTDNGEVLSAQSKTFRQSFEDIVGAVGAYPVPVKKISGKTKAGREYVNCVLDVEAYRVSAGDAKPAKK